MTDPIRILLGLVLPHLLIWGAYTRIPLALLHRRRPPGTRGARFAFAAFILFCGLSHLVTGLLLALYGCAFCWRAWVFAAESSILWATAIVSSYVAWRIEGIVSVSDGLARAADDQAAFVARLHHEGGPAHDR